MLRKIALAACSLVVSALVTTQSCADPFTDLIGLGGDSGKLAKLEFRLRESFGVTAVAWSPNGKYIATASTQGNRIHIWDVQERSIAKELKLESSAIEFHSLAWSPDGRYLAACGKPVLHVYATDTWTDAGSFTAADTGGCVRGTFSSDGRELALLTWPRYVRVFSVPSWQLLKTIEIWDGWAFGDMFKALAYLPRTHALLLAGSEYRRATQSNVGGIWFFEESEVVPSRTLQAYRAGGDHGGAGLVISLAVSPDGGRIATGTHTGNGSPGFEVTESVHILDVATGKLLGAPLDGDKSFGAEAGLAYTPDGRFIIAGHEDDRTRAIHLIDAKTLKVVDVVHASGFVFDVAVNARSTAFAAGAGGQVLVWSLPK